MYTNTSVTVMFFHAFSRLQDWLQCSVVPKSDLLGSHHTLDLDEIKVCLVKNPDVEPLSKLSGYGNNKPVYSQYGWSRFSHWILCTVLCQKSEKHWSKRVGTLSTAAATLLDSSVDIHDDKWFIIVPWAYLVVLLKNMLGVGGCPLSWCIIGYVSKYILWRLDAIKALNGRCWLGKGVSIGAKFCNIFLQTFSLFLANSARRNKWR